MTAYVFPGQGAQYVGMGKDLYESSPLAKQLFEKANEILGFRITDVMFYGQDEDLRQTKVTQPAVFLDSVISECVAEQQGVPAPEMVAGHSLGEYSALTVAGVLHFEDALRLVHMRANAMQQACERYPGTMAAVLRTDDSLVDSTCDDIHDHVVVAANFNCPGQVVISGSIDGVEAAKVALQAKGVKRIVGLNVGGAFHSPLMQPAADDLKKAIMATSFHKPHCPVYQNVNAYPQMDPAHIQQNLVAQLTAPVRWTQTVMNMITDGADTFREFGPGEVLSGLIRKINPMVTIIEKQ